MELLLQELLAQLDSEADKHGFTELEIIRFLGINPSRGSQISSIRSQEDILDSKADLFNVWSNLVSSGERNAKVVASALSKLVIDSMLSDRESEGYKIVCKIEKYREEVSQCNKKSFAGDVLSSCIDGGMESSEYSKLLTDLKLGKLPGFRPERRDKLDSILAFIEIDNSNKGLRTNLKSDDIQKYIQQKFSKKMTLKEMESLQGDYILFKRTSYLDPNKDRLLSISNINFFLDTQSVKFYFSLLSSDGVVRYTEGVVVRDTPQSLKLIGIKTDSEYEKNLSLSILSLSINREALENGKRFINGGLLDGEDENNKPYHTWVHLSKVDDLESLVDMLKDKDVRMKEHVNMYERLLSFFIIRKKSWIDGNESDLNVINESIKNNYNEKPSEYIKDKLYLVKLPTNDEF